MVNGESSSSSDESLESDSTCGTSISDEDSSTNGNESSSSSSEVSFEGQPNESNIEFLNDENTGDDYDVYASSVREWTTRVPIGMNLCPWAKLSHNDRRIKYVTCPSEVQTPAEASEVVWREIENLLGSSASGERNHSLPPWSTTLVICPHVTEWENDYTTFERFVKNFGRGEVSGYGLPKHESQHPENASEAITLVAFHPTFLRWRGLPESIAIGSTICCHKGLAGFSKSPVAHNAIVVDLSPKGFGRRRIRVRFFDDEESTGIEQCIPVEWVVLSENEVRPPLSDNLMHRAPYPTIHILRNKDLKNLSILDISRLKRRNAKRMLSETLV